MSIEFDSALFLPVTRVSYTRDVRDISRGFVHDQEEFYRFGQHWLKFIYFFDDSFSPQRWTNTTRELGKPNEGRTLVRNAGDFWWRLDGKAKYLTLGVYDYLLDEVFWFGVHNLPTGWEVIHQDGSIQELKSGAEQAASLQIAGRNINLKYQLPVQSGGWTDNDVIYQIEEQQIEE